MSYGDSGDSNFQGWEVQREDVSMNFEKMAKEHWEKYLPSLVRGLKAEGMYEEELKSVAEQANRELAGLVANGAQLEAAREIVLKEYILIPPETPD